VEPADAHANVAVLPPAAVPEAKYNASNHAWQGDEFFELAEMEAIPGHLVDDTLVLTVEITVQREKRFALDSGAADGCVSPLNHPLAVPRESQTCQKGRRSQVAESRSVVARLFGC
jgi:hypothetical protein